MTQRSVLLTVRIILCIALILVFSQTAGAKTVQLSMGCGPSVAAGYPAGVALSSYLNKKIPDVKFVPIELGSTAAVRRVAAGEMDLTYSNSFDLVGTYLNKGAFEKNPMKEGTQPYQAIWFWPVVQFMVTRQDTDIYTYDDLKGRDISIGGPKEGLYAFGKAAFEGMGLTSQWNEKIVLASDRSQALSSKSIDAITGVCVAMNTLAGHTVELELYNKLRALKMTKEQEAKIAQVPGVTVFQVPASLFKNDMGMQYIPAIGNAYGWSFSRNVDPEIVYNFVKACFEDASKLKDLARTFEYFSQDPKKTVLEGLKATAKVVPVHPGAARYYKEINLWDETWLEGKTK